MTQLYYTAPDDKHFEAVKEAALEIWNTYEDPYRTEKVNRIKDIQNISDNMMYIIAMFDMSNQEKLTQMLDSDTKQQIYDRMKDGGSEGWQLAMWL